MGGYVAITPAHDEEGNLGRLAASLAAQTVRPDAWIVVENGSSDATMDVILREAARHPWIVPLQISPPARRLRGPASVRAFNAGLALVPDDAAFIANLDADVSLPSDYFERLLAAFAADPRLGIAGGTCFETEDGVWRQRHVTGDTVWGAARVFRRECLDEVGGVEERMSWDSISQLSANARGWRTRTLLDLPFHHHRPEGERDGSRRAAWLAEGRSAHHLWYRPWYLGLRSANHLARGEWAAPLMLAGFAEAGLRREPRSADPLLRAHVRGQQSLGELPRRVREALRGRARHADDAGPAGTRRPTRVGPADVLLVCSTGGHLVQLSSLRPAWGGFERVWVTFDKGDAHAILRGERVVFAHGPTNRSVVNLVRNAALAWRVLRRARPKVVMTTGAGVAVPFAWIGRALGVRIVYVESFTRIDGPSLSCRLIAPVADRIYAQWPELGAAMPRARYVGNVFGTR